MLTPLTRPQRRSVCTQTQVRGLRRETSLQQRARAVWLHEGTHGLCQHCFRTILPGNPITKFAAGGCHRQCNLVNTLSPQATLTAYAEVGEWQDPEAGRGGDRQGVQHLEG